MKNLAKSDSKVAKLEAVNDAKFKQANYEAKLKAVLEAQKAEDTEKAEKKLVRLAKSRKPGIIKTIFNTIAEAKKPVTKEQILEALVVQFPEHTADSMSSTIGAQLGNKRPNRMERENEIVFDVAPNKDGVLTYSYSAE